MYLVRARVRVRVGVRARVKVRFRVRIRVSEGDETHHMTEPMGSTQSVSWMSLAARRA